MLKLYLRRVRELTTIISRNKANWITSNAYKTFKEEAWSELTTFTALHNADAVQEEETHSELVVADKFFKTLDDIVDAENQDNEQIKGHLFPVAVLVFLVFKEDNVLYMDTLERYVPASHVLLDNKIVNPLLRYSISSSTHGWRALKLLCLLIKTHNNLKLQTLELIRTDTYKPLGEAIVGSRDFSRAVYCVILVSIVFPQRKFSTGKPFVSKLWPANKVRAVYYDNFPFSAISGSPRVIEYFETLCNQGVTSRFSKVYQLQHLEFLDLDVAANGDTRSILCHLHADHLLIWVFNKNSPSSSPIFEPLEVELGDLFNINFIDDKVLELEGTWRSKHTKEKMCKFCAAGAAGSYFSVKIELVEKQQNERFLSEIRNYNLNVAAESQQVLYVTKEAIVLDKFAVSEDQTDQADQPASPSQTSIFDPIVDSEIEDTGPHHPENDSATTANTNAHHVEGVKEVEKVAQLAMVLAANDQIAESTRISSDSSEATGASSVQNETVGAEKSLVLENSSEEAKTDNVEKNGNKENSKNILAGTGEPGKGEVKILSVYKNKKKLFDKLNLVKKPPLRKRKAGSALWDVYSSEDSDDANRVTATKAEQLELEAGGVAKKAKSAVGKRSLIYKKLEELDKQDISAKDIANDTTSSFIYSSPIVAATIRAELRRNRSAEVPASQEPQEPQELAKPEPLKVTAKKRGRARKQDKVDGKGPVMAVVRRKAKPAKSSGVPATESSLPVTSKGTSGSVQDPQDCKISTLQQNGKATANGIASCTRSKHSLQEEPPAPVLLQHFSPGQNQGPEISGLFANDYAQLDFSNVEHQLFQGLNLVSRSLVSKMQLMHNAIEAKAEAIKREMDRELRRVYRENEERLREFNEFIARLSMDGNGKEKEERGSTLG